MKKQGLLGTVFWTLAVILALAGIVVYWLNTHGGYYSDFAPGIAVCGAAGAAVLIVLKVLAVKTGEKQWMDILYILAAVLLSWAAVSFLGDRVESAAIILGSSLEAGNVLAKQSLFTAFAGVGCFVLGMILTGVAGFFTQQKEKEDS